MRPALAAYIEGQRLIPVVDRSFFLIEKFMYSVHTMNRNRIDHGE